MFPASLIFERNDNFGGVETGDGVASQNDSLHFGGRDALTAQLFQNRARSVAGADDKPLVRKIVRNAQEKRDLLRKRVAVEALRNDVINVSAVANDDRRRGVGGGRGSEDELGGVATGFFRLFRNEVD